MVQLFPGHVSIVLRSGFIESLELLFQLCQEDHEIHVVNFTSIDMHESRRYRDAFPPPGVAGFITR